MNSSVVQETISSIPSLKFMAGWYPGLYRGNFVWVNDDEENKSIVFFTKPYIMERVVNKKIEIYFVISGYDKPYVDITIYKNNEIACIEQFVDPDSSQVDAFNFLAEYAAENYKEIE